MKQSCGNNNDRDFCVGESDLQNEYGESIISTMCKQQDILMASKCEISLGFHYNETNGAKVKERTKCRKCYCCCFCVHRKESESCGKPFVLSSERVKMVSSSVLVFLLAVGIYWNSLSGDFVHDDVVAIVRNPDVNLARRTDSFQTSQVVQVSSGSGWWSVWKNDYWGMPMISPLSHKSYRPLTVLTFRLNYWMCGEALCPEVFHGTNLFIHGLVSVLTLYISWGILRLKLSSSLFASCLFAVNPIHTEAVAALAGRADALACFMMLVSFIFYHRALKEFNQKAEENESQNSCDTAKLPVPSDGNHNHFLSTSHVFSASSERSSCKSDQSLKSEDSAFSSWTFHSMPKSSRSCLILWKAYGFLLASGAIGFASMLAKETGITVLGISLLYDLYIYLHYRNGERKKRKRREESLVNDATSDENNYYSDKMLFLEQNRESYLKRRLSFLVILIAISLTIRITLMEGTFPRFGRADNPTAYANSNLTSLLTFAYLPVFNIWLIFHPRTLSYDWQMGSIPLVESVWDQRNLAAVAFYVLILLVTWKVVRNPAKKNICALAFSLLFIALPYLPASNLLFPVGFVVAERVLYSTSFGTCILIGIGLECILNFTSSTKTSTKSVLFHLKTSTVACSCLLLISFGLRTWQRNRVWESRLSLFTSGIREVPHNAKMHYNYANLQKDMRNTVAAIEHYTMAIRLWPEYASAHNNLGTLLMRNPAAAEHQFLKAISVANQAHGGAHFNLGVLYMNAEKFSNAATHFKKSLIIDPSHQEAFHYYSVCINMMLKNKTNSEKHQEQNHSEIDKMSSKSSSTNTSNASNSKNKADTQNRENLDNSVNRPSTPPSTPTFLNSSLMISDSADTRRKVGKLYQRQYLMPRYSVFHNSSLFDKYYFASSHPHSWNYFY